MIPSALSAQLQQGLIDFLRFSFWSSTPGMEQVIEDLIARPGALVKGPYISVKLTFVTGMSLEDLEEGVNRKATFVHSLPS